MTNSIDLAAVLISQAGTLLCRSTTQDRDLLSGRTITFGRVAASLIRESRPCV